jgi:2-polyprenyl-3-methyl-5-hydroxy-6-metoxy-1,4-benzoquinol methylase
MPDWQERITRESEPALHVEHDLRYRLAAPLVAAAATWCDLGCGTGIAAAQAFGDSLPARAVLVDVEESALAMAARELRAAGETVPLAGDLTKAADLERVGEALLGGEAPRVVTCFEVIEHLETFIPLVEWLSALAEAGEATVVISVPNDAFWSLENPHHRTMWGEGAFAELARLLPEGAVRAVQLPLVGSAVALAGDEDGTGVHQVPVAVDPAGIPSHFLAAFGPDAGRLAPAAAVTQLDMDAQRAWVRQREANLASTTAELDELRELVRGHTKQFEEWRAYIHELEGRLGLPLSGT